MIIDKSTNRANKTNTSSKQTVQTCKQCKHSNHATGTSSLKPTTDHPRVNRGGYGGMRGLIRRDKKPKTRSVQHKSQSRCQHPSVTAMQVPGPRWDGTHSSTSDCSRLSLHILRKHSAQSDNGERCKQTIPGTDRIRGQITNLIGVS
jgi:hypothetical protein